MKCPYCNNDMQEGILKGDGRTGMKFIREGEKYSIGDTCKKMIIDTDIR